MQRKYEQLDGLRGLAALAVVLYHSSHWAKLPGGRALVPNGYLAVDFFFLLSGFVIAHAYEERLKRPGSFLPFLRDRVIRLHPLLLLGAGMGALTMPLVETVRPSSGIGWLGDWLMASVPFPTLWSPVAFAANTPVWSLFWEIVVNLLFAALAAQLTTRRLILAILPLSVALIGVSIAFQGLDIGARTAELPWTFPRATVGFLLGVLILRVHRRGVLVGERPRPWVGVALIAILVALSKFSRLSALYDPFAVLVAFPVLLLLAAGSPSGMPRLAALSGAVSYPLYLLHLPLLRVVEHLLEDRLGVTMTIPIGLAAVAVIVAIAWAVGRFYDEPLRFWLRARYRGERHDHAAAPAARTTAHPVSRSFRQAAAPAGDG